MRTQQKQSLFLFLVRLHFLFLLQCNFINTYLGHANYGTFLGPFALLQQLLVAFRPREYVSVFYRTSFYF